MKILTACLVALCLRTATAQPDPETPSDAEPAVEVEAPAADSSLAAAILADAASFLGTPYLYGGTGPEGFDCSGLVYRVFGDHGIDLPRTVTGMESAGEPVSREDLEPGDLVIFYAPKHVGIYVGDGSFIHSSSWENRGVILTSLEQENYARRYTSARRVL